MNKLIFVVMTMVSLPAMGDVDLKMKLKTDHQVIKVVDTEYQWMIDVNCEEKLDVEKPTDITVNKNRVQVGKPIKVKQDGKEQSCLVNQMAVTSVW